MKREELTMSWGESEFLNSGVNDKREAKSLARMADRLLMNPELSFSRAVGDGLRRAAWRIFSKQEVDVGYGHYKQTSERCKSYETILVSQDTTDINYQRHYATAGLGDLGGRKDRGHAGLCLHTAMAINAQGLPLGLVGQKVWPPVACGRSQRLQHYALEEKESYRWVEALQWTGQYLSHIQQVIIVSDRESDFYDYMLAPRSQNSDLLFRALYLNRWVYSNGQKLKLGQVLLPAASQVDIGVPRAKNRPARTAQIQVSWGEITCPAPVNRKGDSLSLWLVKAQEINPPDKAKAISWYLLTTMAVTDEAAALLMIDYYRRRWLIERWHLVLKQGLQIERLQFDNFERLANAIKLLSIVAWQLLCLKQLAAQVPDLPAQEVFEPLQLEVLQKQKGTKQLSLRQAFIVMAALAGFTPTKKQPLPGEKTIWQAWAIFNAFCQGYQLAFQKRYGTG
jgi:hypothetical protein